MMKMPLAPVAEQCRIVEKVEALLEQVHRAKTRLDRLPLILKGFRRAVLAAACSGALTQDWRDEHPDIEPATALRERIWAARLQRLHQSGNGERPKTGTTSLRPMPTDLDLPDLPSSWCWACWDDLADWITYGFTRPMPHVANGIPIVTARHVARSEIDYDAVDYTTSTAFQGLSPKDRPRKGEILLTKDGSIGRAAIVSTDEPFCINQSVALIRFGGLSADPDYLLRIIESPWTQHLIDEGAKGSAIRHIAITAFGRLPMPLAPLEEQKEIARRVSALLISADLIQQRMNTARALTDSLPQAVLAKAFSGELVSTEAEVARAEGRTYETAAELLARIQAQGRTTDKTAASASRRTASRGRRAVAIRR